MPLPNFLQIGQDIANRLLTLENELTQENQNLTNHEDEVIQAIEELTQEYGGTVTRSVSVQTMSVDDNDPWKDLNEGD